MNLLLLRSQLLFSTYEELAKKTDVRLQVVLCAMPKENVVY